MKNVLIIIVLFFISTSTAFTCCLSDSTLSSAYVKSSESYIKSSEYTTKMKLVKNFAMPYPNNSLQIKSQNQKIASILRIVALPFFVTAIITNNSKDLSKGLLITGATLELTSVYLELHKQKNKYYN